MGMYLDSKTAYALYKKEMQKTYFVDKSSILKELCLILEEGGDYICITRPRRFGKTVMANMIAAFFARVCNTADLFDSLEIAGEALYVKYRNRYPVIHVPFNDMMRPYTTYEDYIKQIEQQLLEDLKMAYPGFFLENEDSVAAALLKLYAADDTVQFIFVLDE